MIKNLLIVLLVLVIVVLLYTNKSTYLNNKVGNFIATGSSNVIQSLPNALTAGGVTAYFFSVQKVNNTDGSTTNSMVYYDANKNPLPNFRPLIY